MDSIERRRGGKGGKGGKGGGGGGGKGGGGGGGGGKGGGGGGGGGGGSLSDSHVPSVSLEAIGLSVLAGSLCWPWVTCGGEYLVNIVLRSEDRSGAGDRRAMAQDCAR
jgi:hypothetical protein